MRLAQTTLKLTDDNGSDLARGRASDRRRFRRHELCVPQGLVVEVLDDADPAAGGRVVGTLLDVSAGGVRLISDDATLRPGTAVTVRLRLPDHAGIAPFVASDATGGLRPAHEWTGELCVMRRVQRLDGRFDVGGSLAGMGEATRGMLGLYLSLQPLAA